jgi:hypothetical protein
MTAAARGASCNPQISVSRVFSRASPSMVASTSTRKRSGLDPCLVGEPDP